MSKFDVSTNRIPFGLLTSEEQAELIEAAGVKGAWVECNSALVPKWHDTTSNVLWRMDCAYRVHLPAAPVAELNNCKGCLYKIGVTSNVCKWGENTKAVSCYLKCTKLEPYGETVNLAQAAPVVPPKPKPVKLKNYHTDKCAFWSDCHDGFDHPRDCDCGADERELQDSKKPEPVGYWKMIEPGCYTWYRKSVGEYPLVECFREDGAQWMHGTCQPGEGAVSLLITATEYESAKQASRKVEPPAPTCWLCAQELVGGSRCQIHHAMPPTPTRIEPLSDRAKYTRHQAANLCWYKVNELCEAWNERVGAK